MSEDGAIEILEKWRKKKTGRHWAVRSDLDTPSVFARPVFYIELYSDSECSVEYDADRPLGLVVELALEKFEEENKQD